MDGPGLRCCFRLQCKARGTEEIVKKCVAAAGALNGEEQANGWMDGWMDGGCCLVFLSLLLGASEKLSKSVEGYVPSPIPSQSDVLAQRPSTVRENRAQTLATLPLTSIKWGICLFARKDKIAGQSSPVWCMWISPSQHSNNYAHQLSRRTHKPSPERLFMHDDHELLEPGL
jgi:hypothetical protein